jgi:hypothetical protein
VADRLPSRRIVPLSLLQRVSLHPEHHRKHGGERVCEVQDAKGRHNRSQAREVGNPRGEDEGNGPVKGDQARPCPLSGGGVQPGSAEYLDKDVVIDDWKEMV